MNGRRLTLVVIVLGALLLGGLGNQAAAQAKPEGEMRWALYVTLSPLWFDPAEVTGVWSLRSGFSPPFTMRW